MYKSLALLSALCASALAASPYFVDIKNNAGTEGFRFNIVYEIRDCICVNNTQIGSITGVNGGNIKLFSTSDCTGKYKYLGSNNRTSNTQWVNSFSFGASGVPTPGPGDYCPNCDNYGDDGYRLRIFYETKDCICIKNTQTGSITGSNGGSIKLPSSSDCAGNFQTTASSSTPSG
ncbi:hypothetical protein BG000_001423 [Podila horticola]|nr:hypothetical protein BG000_001423 [Podila horticola]